MGTKSDNSADPLVTIGIPFTDQGQILRSAIQSVIAQTYHNWELILFGDCPDEPTLEVARSFVDPRINIRLNTTRRGLASVLNSIALEAKGFFCARMDGDDIMHPLRIERQVEHLQTNSAIDVLGTKAYVIDQWGQLRGGFVEPELPSSGSGYLDSNAFTHPTIMAKTEWFRQNPYNEALMRAQDKDLWLASHGHSVFHKLDDRLLFYRIPDEMNWRRQSNNYRYDREIIRKHSDKAKSRTDLTLRILKSHLKQILFQLIARSGASDKFYARKLIKLGRHEESSAKKTLDNLGNWGNSSKNLVTAVTVTYGARVHLVRQTIDGAFAAGADHVILIDNGTSSEIQHELREEWAGDNRVTLHRLPINRGSAEGFSEGIRAALETEGKYIWLLDDDNVPDVGSVSSLLTVLESAQEHSKPIGVVAQRLQNRRHAEVLGGVPANKAYPTPGSFMYFDMFTHFRKNLGFHRRKEVGVALIPSAPYGGLLIERDTPRIIGLPNTSLCLYEDDTEWTSRIAEHGSLLLTNSLTVADIDGKWTEMSEGLGPSRMLLSNNPVRLFLSVRNRVHYDLSKVQSFPLRVRFELNRTLYVGILRILSKKHKSARNLNIINEAISAAKIRDFSKTLDSKCEVI